MSGMRAIQVEEALMNVNAGAGAGTTKKVERFDMQNATVQTIMTSGTYQLEISNDGTNWVEEGSSIIGPQVVTIGVNCRFIRVVTGDAGDAEFILFAQEILW